MPLLPKSIADAQCSAMPVLWNGLARSKPDREERPSDWNRFGLKEDTMYVVELCQQPDGTRFVRWREFPSGECDPDHAFESEPGNGLQFIEWERRQYRTILRLTTGDAFAATLTAPG